MTSGHAPGEAVAGVTLSFTTLAGIATVLRLFTRIHIVRSAGLDDIAISVAMALSIVLTITMCQQVKYGMGRHQDDLSPDEKVNSLIWFWASVWVYYLALCFAKLSILLQYLRIFPDRKFRVACFALIGIVVGWTFWAFFSAVFACWPIRHFWHADIPGICLNRLAVWFSNASVNIVTDVCTTMLPLPVLNSLNVPGKQRFLLMAVFGLGGVTCIISILRLQGLYAISKTTDVSWENPLTAIWSSLEVNVGIICSCLPTMKGCVSRYFPNLFSSSHGSHHLSGDLELSGPHGRSHASCTANRSQVDKRSGGLSRLGRKFGAGGGATDIQEVEEGSEGTFSEKGSLEDGVRSPNIPRIQVTTVVEQEEESLATHESESIKGLVPTLPYEGA